MSALASYGVDMSLRVLSSKSARAAGDGGYRGRIEASVGAHVFFYARSEAHLSRCSV